MVKGNEEPAAATQDAPIGVQVAVRERQVQRRSLLEGRFVLALDVALLLAFGVLTALALGLKPLAFDVPVTHELQEMQWGAFSSLMIDVSSIGFAPWLILIPVGVAALLVLLRVPWEALWVLLAAGSSSSAELVKRLVERPRPTPDLVSVYSPLSSYSFPSGHVTSYVVFYGFVFYLAWTSLKNPWLRVPILIVSGGLILLVGPSRIWLGQHWTSDVLGGYTLGFLLLLIIIQLHRAWSSRRVKQPVNSESAPANAAR